MKFLPEVEVKQPESNTPLALCLLGVVVFIGIALADSQWILPPLAYVTAVGSSLLFLRISPTRSLRIGWGLCFCAVMALIAYRAAIYNPDNVKLPFGATSVPATFFGGMAGFMGEIALVAVGILFYVNLHTLAMHYLAPRLPAWLVQVVVIASGAAMLVAYLLLAK